MRSPLYALLLAPDLDERHNVEVGTKTITIREGHRDYQAKKPVMICCHVEPWCVMADISSVRHCSLRDVTEAELRDDGYTDLDDMLSQLREYYPTLTPSSPVTVIRWENVRGKLVDEREND